MTPRFHHLAIACFDIEKTSDLYCSLGYKKGDIFPDDIQKVKICFLTGDSLPTIELIEPNDPKSPVNAILKKNGVTPYHLCFATGDIEKASGDLLAAGYVRVSPQQKAVAIESNAISFFYHKHLGLIELVEMQLK